MRLNTTNNKFIFNFPVDFIDPWLYTKLEDIMLKNMIPYESILEYINSTIKELVFPSMSFENVEQTLKRGKIVNWKSAKNILDAFTNEIDITFRSVDSNMNYFILLQVLSAFYLDTKKEYLTDFSISILDKNGDQIYTILFKEVILKSISETRLGYQMFDLSEKPFTVTFKYNFIDIIYELGDKRQSIFDVPINFKEGELDNTGRFSRTQPNRN